MSSLSMHPGTYLGRLLENTTSRGLLDQPSTWTPSWKASLLLLVLAYPVFCNVLRFQRIKSLPKQYGYAARTSYSQMTDNQAHKIIEVMADLEFPALYEKGLQLALFRTYGIPTISALLVKTTQLGTQKNVGKRYADTAALLSEIYGASPTDARSREAFARLNYLHGHYLQQGKITNDDMLYTLSLFMIEPVRMINHYEWRHLTDLEVCAMGVFHKSMGDAMDIHFDDLPSSKAGFRDGLHFYEELETWSVAYETRVMVPHQDNYAIALQTQNLLLLTFPSLVHPFMRNVISAAMDDRLRQAIKFDEPPKSYVQRFQRLMACRQFLMRYLSLPRPWFARSRLSTDTFDDKGYTHFSRYDTLPYYIEPTLMNRWGPRALVSRLMGLPLPGDAGYHPEGFKTSDVGPSVFYGKGHAEAEKTKQRLVVERTGGCPFAIR